MAVWSTETEKSSNTQYCCLGWGSWFLLYGSIDSVNLRVCFQSPKFLHLLLLMSSYLIHTPPSRHPSHVFTGYPAMPIYWALGYHLCRWGYNTSDSVLEVVKSMRNYGIPQVKLTQQTVCLCVCRYVFFAFFCENNYLPVDLFTGRPVEWYRLHGPIYGLHFWLNEVRHTAWSGQGPARSWPTLRHDPGTQEFVFAPICVCCISFGMFVLTVVSQPAGPRYQQHSAWGFVLAVRWRAEERRFY